MNESDLRVLRTRAAIKSAFEQMVCELDYDQLTVSELASRAHINRKTFYLHYQSIDELMDDVVIEPTVAEFTGKDVSYASIDDIAGIVRFYMTMATKQSKLHERIMCEPSYRSVYERISRRIMDYRREHNKGALHLDPLAENIVYAFFESNSPTLYRQWVADGKKMPLEDFIELSIGLVTHGMAYAVPGYQQQLDHQSTDSSASNQ
ncbi:regulatory protein, TetR family [Bifidobacterium saguini DSM 23967]|uniref:Regulatory protein, TetR family n=2 Tax=Bifidobacterium saguini TaxID=762210 RepID=A0A087D9X0_9BIFI|nr:helix-turn-helix domain-containing protein [Bifidobacterium saguini]KFI92320.1 regulatory protein, TetR family [Bifidobacterium saguini DSM 23967]QTB91020.1 helix-turn-helix transcriptional regulator [Bifidobacterium saguini]